MDEQVSVCRICGKALTDPESVDAGIGPICASRVALLGEQQARLAEAIKDAVPEGYVPLSDALAVCHEYGIPVSRLVKAMGGDRLWYPPIGPAFFPIYNKGKRYLPAAVLTAIPEQLSDDAVANPKAEPKPKAKAKGKKVAVQPEVVDDGISLDDENPTMETVPVAKPKRVRKPKQPKPGVTTPAMEQFAEELSDLLKL